MLRLAIVGAGHLGRFHAKLAAELDDVEVVGIVDPLMDTARQVAVECGTAAFADLDELLDRMDAAIVATPTRYHHSVGCELLRRGVHVLMEKPLATSRTECDELVRLAEENRLVLQVGHIERFNPAFQQATPYLRAPKYIEAARYSGFSFRSTDIGVVLDLMIHDLDLAMTIVGAPVADVSAFGLALLGQHEDVARARLHFANGAIADFAASRVSYQARRQTQVWCGGCHVNMDFATRTAMVAQPAANVRQGQFHIDKLSGEEKMHLKDHFFEDVIPIHRLEGGATNALLEEQRDFVGAIRSGRAPQVTGAQGREVLAVAERILDSVAAHRWDNDSSEDGNVTAAAIGEPASNFQGAHILRGPHWQRSPSGNPNELRRPA